MSTLRNIRTALLLLCGAQLAHPADVAEPPQPVVTPLMTKDLSDLPGREILTLSVVYPPGAVEHVLRHDAFAVVYVLEGSIIGGGGGGGGGARAAGRAGGGGPGDI